MTADNALPKGRLNSTSVPPDIGPQSYRAPIVAAYSRSAPKEAVSVFRKCHRPAALHRAKESTCAGGDDAARPRSSHRPVMAISSHFAQAGERTLMSVAPPSVHG